MQWFLLCSATFLFLAVNNVNGSEELSPLVKELCKYLIHFKRNNFREKPKNISEALPENEPSDINVGSNQNCSEPSKIFLEKNKYLNSANKQNWKIENETLASSKTQCNIIQEPAVIQKIIPEIDSKNVELVICIKKDGISYNPDSCNSNYTNTKNEKHNNMSQCHIQRNKSEFFGNADLVYSKFNRYENKSIIDLDDYQSISRISSGIREMCQKLGDIDCSEEELKRNISEHNDTCSSKFYISFYPRCNQSNELIPNENSNDICFRHRYPLGKYLEYFLPYFKRCKVQVFEQNDSLSEESQQFTDIEQNSTNLHDLQLFHPNTNKYKECVLEFFEHHAKNKNEASNTSDFCEELNSTRKTQCNSKYDSNTLDNDCYELDIEICNHSMNASSFYEFTKNRKPENVCSRCYGHGVYPTKAVIKITSPFNVISNCHFCRKYPQISNNISCCVPTLNKLERKNIKYDNKTCRDTNLFCCYTADTNDLLESLTVKQDCNHNCSTTNDNTKHLADYKSCKANIPEYFIKRDPLGKKYTNNKLKFTDALLSCEVLKNHSGSNKTVDCEKELSTYTNKGSKENEVMDHLSKETVSGKNCFLLRQSPNKKYPNSKLNKVIFSAIRKLLKCNSDIMDEEPNTKSTKSQVLCSDDSCSIKSFFDKNDERELISKKGSKRFGRKLKDLKCKSVTQSTSETRGLKYGVNNETGCIQLKKSIPKPHRNVLTIKSKDEYANDPCDCLEELSCLDFGSKNVSVHSIADSKISPSTGKDSQECRECSENSFSCKTEKSEIKDCKDLCMKNSNDCSSVDHIYKNLDMNTKQNFSLCEIIPVIKNVICELVDEKFDASSNDCNSPCSKRYTNLKSRNRICDKEMSVKNILSVNLKNDTKNTSVREDCKQQCDSVKTKIKTIYSNRKKFKSNSDNNIENDDNKEFLYEKTFRKSKKKDKTHCKLNLDPCGSNSEEEESNSIESKTKEPISKNESTNDFEASRLEKQIEEWINDLCVIGPDGSPKTFIEFITSLKGKDFNSKATPFCYCNRLRSLKKSPRHWSTSKRYNYNMKRKSKLTRRNQCAKHRVNLKSKRKCNRTFRMT